MPRYPSRPHAPSGSSLDENVTKQRRRRLPKLRKTAIAERNPQNVSYLGQPLTF
jgi:hypothetical protein